MRETLGDTRLFLLSCALGGLVAAAAVPDAARAQGAAPVPAAAPALTGAVAASDDLEALVAPVALYPDPLLSVILQASTLPLQIVQADRYLARRAKDPSAVRPADFDPSIVALMNYPKLVAAMNEAIDWTEELGEAVLARLEDVQVAIQELRWGAYSRGILQSDEAIRVTVQGNVIAIDTAENDRIRLPQYDPVALLAALEPVEPEPGAPAAPSAPVTTAPPPTTPAPAASTAPPPASAAEAPAPAAPATQAAAPTGAVPVEPAAVAPTYAPAPAYYAPAPAYAPAPVVAYSEPQSSFWSGTATFLGGAAIGGLLGYALADDDDDDDDGDGCGRYCWDDDWDGDGKNNAYKNNKINIEDNTIVVADNDELKKNLNQRRAAVQPAGVGGVGRPGGVAGVGGVGGRQQIAALPAAGSPARREVGARTQGAPRATRDVQLPAPAGRPAGAEAARPGERVGSPQHRQQAQGTNRGRVPPTSAAGLGGANEGKRAAEAQAQRGSQSRAKSAAAPAAPRAQAQPQAQRAQAPRRDTGSALEARGSEKRVKREASRGAASRSGGGGGGARGGGRGGRG